MKYDREWLESIRLTENIIKDTPINMVPFPQRGPLQRAFDAQVASFRHDVAGGFDPAKSQSAILELANLVLELVEEADKNMASLQHPTFVGR